MRKRKTLPVKSSPKSRTSIPGQPMEICRTQRGSLQGSTALSFRPDLLIKNLAIKPGFLLPGYGFGKDAFVNQCQVIEAWDQLLQKHEKYKELKVNSTASFPEVLEELNRFTNQIFKGFEWTLITEEKEEVHLNYWKYKEPLYNFFCPLEWIDQHQNKEIRTAALEVIKMVSQHFGIEMIRYHHTEYLTDNYSDEDSLKEYIVIEHDEMEDEEYTQDLYNQLHSFSFGRLKDLFHEVNAPGLMKPGELKEIMNSFRESDPHIYIWLISGLELLKLESFDLNDFVLNGGCEDHEGLNLPDLMFFPYSFNGYVWDYINSNLDSVAQTSGMNAVYEKGTINRHANHEPKHFKDLKKVQDFIVEGSNIYNNFYKDGDYKLF